MLLGNLSRSIFTLLGLVAVLNAFTIKRQASSPSHLNSIYDKTNGLNRTGSNVCKYQETVTKLVNTTYLSTRWTTVYYKTCDFWGCKKISRLGTKQVVSHRLETKYIDRDVYYCCNGWKRPDNTHKSCDIPTCAFACKNGGKCVAPDKCQCVNGYYGSYCQFDNNECQDPSKNDCSQVCINIQGGFKCGCNSGYTLDSDGKTCLDINECSTKKACGCQAQDGVCQATCTNTMGSYKCACPKGYFLNSAELCEDRNECFLDQTLCDHKCLNTPGGYQCQCFKGYHLNNVTNKCQDTNECSIQNGGCTDQCVNLNGTYVCLCPKGKYLADDGKTCKDIDLKSKSETFCQSGALGMLTCDNINDKIKITSVFYGRLTDKICKYGDYTSNLNCNALNAKDNLKECNGMSSCLVMMDMWTDPCPGVEKYTKINYRCE